MLGDERFVSLQDKVRLASLVSRTDNKMRIVQTYMVKSIGPVENVKSSAFLIRISGGQNF